MQIFKFHKQRKKEKNNAPENREPEYTWEVERKTVGKNAYEDRETEQER